MTNLSGLSVPEMSALLAALLRARAAGVSSVKFREREVQYKSDSEMATAIRDLEARISGGRSSVGVAGFSRGDW